MWHAGACGCSSVVPAMDCKQNIAAQSDTLGVPSCNHACLPTEAVNALNAGPPPNIWQLMFASGIVVFLLVEFLDQDKQSQMTQAKWVLMLCNRNNTLLQNTSADRRHSISCSPPRLQSNSSRRPAGQTLPSCKATY